MAANRKKHRGPTPPKKRPAPVPAPARPATLAPFVDMDVNREEMDLFDKTAEGVPEGWRVRGVTVIGLSNATLDAIIKTLDGQPVPRAARDAAAADLHAQVREEAKHNQRMLDGMVRLRDWRTRQIAHLEARLVEADFGNAFLPPAGGHHEIRAASGALRAQMDKMPDLKGAWAAVRRHFDRDEAQAIFDETMAKIPEPGAYEADYLDAMREVVARRHPDLAKTLAEVGSISD